MNPTLLSKVRVATRELALQPPLLPPPPVTWAPLRLEQACSLQRLQVYTLFPCCKHPSLTCELSVASGLWALADVSQLPLSSRPLVIGSLQGSDLTGCSTEPGSWQVLGACWLVERMNE